MGATVAAFIFGIVFTVLGMADTSPYFEPPLMLLIGVAFWMIGLVCWAVADAAAKQSREVVKSLDHLTETISMHGDNAVYQLQNWRM